MTPPGTLAIVDGAAAMGTTTARASVTATTAARPDRARREIRIYDAYRPPIDPG